jgi:hypothetical protein
MRPDGKCWLIVSLLCLWPLSASADDGDVAKVISECGAPDLPQASVDSCLERVRVLEETQSSSQLQTLEAGLEQREGGRPVRTRAASVAAAPRAVEVAPEPPRATEGEGEPGELASQYAAQDRSPPRSGPALEDEPPVADAPDVTSGGDGSTDEDTNDPPES